MEVWRVKIRNINGRPVELQLFSYVEFCLWDALDDMTNFQRNFSIGEVEVEDNVIYHKTGYRERRNHFSFFACSEPLTGFNDDPLWLVVSVAAYIKETGDFSILHEQVAYENTLGTEQPLYEHLTKAIQYTLNRLGPHGLPLMGHADWNDCLNLNCLSKIPEESFQTVPDRTDGKTAESIFIGGLFTLAAKEMADIADRIGRLDEAAKYRRLAEEMAKRVLEYGWDGEWFLRAYDAFGKSWI